MSVLSKFINGFVSNIIYILVIVFLFFLPSLIQNPYYLHILIFIGIYIILAQSLNLINGYTGLLSIGHAAFYGIGAYSSALLTMKACLPFVPALFCSGIIAGMFGYLIGKPTLRLKGIFLALATLGFNIIFVLIVLNWVWLTRGPLGIASIPQPRLFSYTLTDQSDYYYLIFFLSLLVMFSLYRLLHSRFGNALIAIREDEDAAKAVGVDTVHYKLAAFSIAAFYAGLAGSFFAHYIRFIAPDSFTFWESFTLLAMLAFGGQGNLVGPTLGASLLIAVPELFRPLAEHRMTFYGLLLIFMMLFRREGIFGGRGVSLRIKPPWVKREEGPMYLRGDKFLPDEHLET